MNGLEGIQLCMAYMIHPRRPFLETESDKERITGRLPVRMDVVDRCKQKIVHFRALVECQGP